MAQLARQESGLQSQESPQNTPYLSVEGGALKVIQPQTLQQKQTAPAFADPAILEAQKIQKARDAILTAPYLTVKDNVLTVTKPTPLPAGRNQNVPAFSPAPLPNRQAQLGQSAAAALNTLKPTPYASTQVPQTVRSGGAADPAIPEAQKTYDKIITGMIAPAILDAQKTYDMIHRPPQIAGQDNLGYLSGVGESGNDPGIISSGKGDLGGKSYGAFQFSSKSGIPKTFLSWLETESTDIYKQLETAFEADGNTTGDNFDKAWKQIAKDNKEQFFKLQYEFTQYKYYDSFVEVIKGGTGFDIDSRSFALKNVFWSRVVQHGNADLIKNVLNSLDLSTVTDEEIIRAIYEEDGLVVKVPPSSKSQPMTGSTAEQLGISGQYMRYYSGNSSDVQISVWKRLHITELEKALELLDKYR